MEDGDVLEVVAVDEGELEEDVAGDEVLAVGAVVRVGGIEVGEELEEDVFALEVVLGDVGPPVDELVEDEAEVEDLDLVVAGDAVEAVLGEVVRAGLDLGRLDLGEVLVVVGVEQLQDDADHRLRVEVVAQ